jgi:hypothetical protein
VIFFTRLCNSKKLQRLCVAAALALLSVQSGYAERQLPQDGKYAKKAELNYPFVKLGKQIVRLAVGGKIYNEQNLIIMPTSAPRSADVLYRLDINGEISQIWILTPEESKLAAKAASERK